MKSGKGLVKNASCGGTRHSARTGLYGPTINRAVRAAPRESNTER